MVYSNAAKVELKFTPKDGGPEESWGVKEFTERPSEGGGYTYRVDADAPETYGQNLYLTFTHDFEEGTLRAVAYDSQGREITDTVGRSEVKTSGPAASLNVTADREEITADGYDLSYVTIDVLDEAGNPVPNAADTVTVEVTGNGKLLAMDNGRQSDHTNYNAGYRNAYNGKVLAIVQSTHTAGSFTVTATAEGLAEGSVTVRTAAAEEQAEDAIESVTYSRHYYVKTGHLPTLPSTVQATLSSGETKELPVSWEEIPQGKENEVGVFTVRGTLEGGYPVSVFVSMIDRVGALLNYSTVTKVGEPVVLPPERPAVMPDGEILETSFPVSWEEIPQGKENETGTFTVNGTATVLGQELSVSANVRVEEETVHYVDNLAPAAALEVDTQLDENDNLSALTDGVKDDPAEHHRWTNYASSQEGDTDAELTFTFDTQLIAGKIVVYFLADSYSARFPDPNTTEILLSDDGSEWTPVEAEESIGSVDATGEIQPYTYTFEPQGTYCVKIRVHNKDEQLEGRKPCTGMVEVEIYNTVTSLDVYSTAEFESLTVNRQTLSPSQIEKGEYGTPGLVAYVDAVSRDNASVTVLPEYNKQKVILLQSEDQQTVRKFIVLLEQPAGEISVDDDTRDYPTDKITASAGSEQLSSANEGPARFALDGDWATWWHTNWSTLPPREDLWIQFELEQPTKLEALRYLPRSGTAQNGFITKYKVEVKTGEEDAWREVATGEWERDGTQKWYLAPFDEVVEAKAVRLTGLETYGDTGNNKFASAAEVRLRTPFEPTLISDEASGISAEVEQEVHVKHIDEKTPAEPHVTVTEHGEELLEKVDYTLAYRNNTSAGAARVTVTGIGNYTGEITLDFRIVVDSDKEALRQAVSAHEAERLPQTGYTKSSWRTYAGALKKAQRVLENESADQDEVDAALAELEAAFAGLIERWSDIELALSAFRVASGRDLLTPEITEQLEDIAEDGKVTMMEAYVLYLIASGE